MFGGRSIRVFRDGAIVGRCLERVHGTVVTIGCCVLLDREVV